MPLSLDCERPFIGSSLTAPFPDGGAVWGHSGNVGDGAELEEIVTKSGPQRVYCL